MHLEAHGLYEPWAPLINCGEIKMLGVGSGLQSPETSYIERPHPYHGIVGKLMAMDFWKYPRFVLLFPPVVFDSHELGKYPGWRLKVSQNRVATRPRLSLMNSDGFGVRLRLPAKSYVNWEDVIETVNKTYKVMGSELATVKMVTPPVIYCDRTVYVDKEVDIVDEMAKDNAATLKRLGTFRPKPKLNVVSMMERLDTAEPSPAPPVIDALKALSA